MASSSSIAADGTVPRLKIDRTVAAIAVGAFGISFGVVALALRAPVLVVVVGAAAVTAAARQFS